MTGKSLTVDTEILTVAELEVFIPSDKLYVKLSPVVLLRLGLYSEVPSSLMNKVPLVKVNFIQPLAAR